MQKSFRRVLLGLVGAAFLNATLVATAAAVADAADYVVWRFAAPGPSGVGLMHEGASSTTLTAETVGLRANTSYRYVGSTAWCGDVHQPLNVLWSRNAQSNAKGAAYVDANVGSDALAAALRSIRLFQGPNQVDCAKPLPYQSNGNGAQPNDALAMISAYGTRLLVFVDSGVGNDSVTAAGHGFIASHGYRLVGASVACPSQPTASSTAFAKSGTTDSLGILWRHDSGTNFASAPPKSIQLFSPSGRVACARPILLSAVQ